MIEYIRRDPLFKKILLILTMILLILTILILAVHYYIVGDIHRENARLTYSIVGRLTTIYPEAELDIVKNAIYTQSEEDIKKGEGILNKYGYDKSINIFHDNNFKKYSYKLLNIDIVLMLTIMTISYVFYMKFVKAFVDKIEILSTAIDNIDNNNFKIDMDYDEEGILSSLNIRFKQMTRRLELTLKELTKEKENIKSLVTDISHQIKTPLSSIKLFNFILLENVTNEEERREFLERSKKEINKLQWLTDSLMKISALEAGMITLNIKKRDIKETILEAINGIYIKALDKNISINTDIKNVEVCHDIKWTKEAIFNVLENSIKYTNKDGQVNISTIETEFYLQINIEDNGIGIPSKEFNDIFKRFYRGKSKEINQIEGSGVGLYLTRKILEDQKGSILVDSKERVGTKFSILLQKSK
ncbi:sensor signal transduction histidine kinase [Gottschalkia purinilytica]|uniref:histidine kinase n=1 Tax=Gottschalkia purinilytica TaxID=1503 RepID=A0A0L0WAC1_GOTPU|nr:HAMP domain-containing sensor histidine kinase [Gottschalkia purinilytica]KNF08270.1 sensor signal transduction histidine kinase [Gottschalkia purinilytica]